MRQNRKYAKLKSTLELTVAFLQKKSGCGNSLTGLHSLPSPNALTPFSKKDLATEEGSWLKTNLVANMKSKTTGGL